MRHAVAWPKPLMCSALTPTGLLSAAVLQFLGDQGLKVIAVAVQVIAPS